MKSQYKLIRMQATKKKKKEAQFIQPLLIDQSLIFSYLEAKGSHNAL